MEKFFYVREAGRTPCLSERKIVFFIHYTPKFLCNQCGDPWIGTRAFTSFWDLYAWSRSPHFQLKILPYGTRPTLRRDLDHIRIGCGRRLIACWHSFDTRFTLGWHVKLCQFWEKNFFSFFCIFYLTNFQNCGIIEIFGLSACADRPLTCKFTCKP